MGATRGHNAAARPGPTYFSVSQADEEGRNPDGSWNWEALKRGIRRADGDMVFFNRSFIEDPWKSLVGPDET